MSFEFNLHLTIRVPRAELVASKDEMRSHQDALRHALDQIRDFLDTPQWAPLGSDRNVRGEVVVLNGSPALIGFGGKNHNNNMDFHLKQLLMFVGHVAPASFGFAHMLDQETAVPGFVVLTLARGEVVERQDQWLSPMIPTVEGWA